jgi:hypothetical protein
MARWSRKGSRVGHADGSAIFWRERFFTTDFVGRNRVDT